MNLPVARPRIWLKAFWGFNPEQAGYLGFTLESVRNKLIAAYQEGDLVLIYGADVPETERRLRGQALGILEIEPLPTSDREWMSAEAISDKASKGWAERWTFAVPVKRAWRVSRRIAIQYAAPRTDWRIRGRVIASQGELMDEVDAEKVWAWPVREVSVFGRTSLLTSSAEEIAFDQAYSPSRGVAPSFGEILTTRVDGPCCLYLLQFEGDLATFLGRSHLEVRDQKLIKVGFSNDLDRRVSEVNSGFPPSAKARWKMRLKSRPFPSAKDALDAENRLKKAFDCGSASQGREFFLCREKMIDNIFASIASEVAFRIG